MALAEVAKTVEPAYTMNDAIDALLGKLNEVIDDMENDKARTIEEAWEENDKV